uniref:C2 domain-containing protein n=1 Tax=Trichuris muris TaxID=70415 RepID=A0A5S6QAN4_TRIMR
MENVRRNCGREESWNVQILLKRGKSLAVCDSSGSSDPYVKFKYNGKLVHKSKIIYQNVNPIWNEQFSFITSDMSHPLQIQVYDYDRFASDDFMGSAKLHLNAFRENKIYEVQISLARNDSSSAVGFLFVQVLISQPMKEVDEKQYASTPVVSTLETSKRNGRVESHQSTVVNVSLVKGRGLLPIVINEVANLPDPFVKLKIGNERLKSKAVTKTLEPEWNEKFNFHLHGAKKDEEIELIVHDRRKDVFLGKGIFKLSQITEDGTYAGWVDLQDCAGQLFLAVSLSNSADSPVSNSSCFSRCSTFDESNLQQRYSLSKSFSNIQDVGCLMLTVFKAQGLAAADIGGKSDPFCVLELVNARFQTRTEYKTLNPEWNQTFMFSVKDMYSVLEITVYDEDPNGRTEFLGKIAIPLYKIEDGRKRWYRLKNSKLTQVAKGRILLEGKIYWNPIRASLRTFMPKEKKFIGQDKKFKRQIFMRYVNRLRSSASSIVDLIMLIKQLLRWENPVKSVLALITFIIVVYIFELYMVPLIMLTIFAQKFVKKHFSSEEAEDKSQESEWEDTEETEERKSLRSKLVAVQEAMCTVQGVLGYLACLVERIRNLFNFTEPFLSSIACLALVAGFFILYYVPIRWLIIIWGINKFTKRLRDPNAIQNNEVLDFLSRIPSEDEQKMFEDLLCENAMRYGANGQ